MTDNILPRYHREWVSVEEAAQHVNVSRDLIKGAIIRGELDAYEKPPTRVEKSAHVQLRIKLTDIDEWVRTWPKAGPQTWGLPSAS